MSKKFKKSLITWGIIIAVIAAMVIALITVVNKKEVVPVFETDSTNKILLQYNGKDSDIVIPKNIEIIATGAFENNTTIEKLSFEEDSKIKEIARNAFKGCVSLTSVVFPNSLETIGESAFEECISIVTVNIPRTTKTINAYAFKGCASVQSIDVKDGLLTIKKGAFEGTDIEYFFIPGTVETIESGVFANCINLAEIGVSDANENYGFDNTTKIFYKKQGTQKEIINVCKTTSSILSIPTDVVKIHENAVLSADNLEEIIVPQSVESIGKDAFKKCENLITVTLPFIGGGKDNETTTFPFVFGSLPVALRTVTITGGNKVIEKAFKDVNTLETINLPTTINQIGKEAFAGCTSLSVINNIPTTLEVIPNSAFLNCAVLENEVITNVLSSTALEIIEESAFEGCDTLTTVEISNSVKHIAISAFAKCDALEKITLPFIGMGKKVDPQTGKLTDVTSTDFGFGYIFGITNPENHKTPKGDNVNYIPENLKHVTITSKEALPSEAFLYCGKVETIVLADGIKSIGERAFSGCSKLKSINIPETVSTIGKEAFAGCSDLASIALSSAVTKLEEKLFSGCTKLTSIDLSYVTELGDKVFEGCAALSNIIFADANPSYEFVNDETNKFKALFTKGQTELIMYLSSSTAQEFSVPSTVTKIKAGAFVNCRRLTTLNIPSTVLEIEPQAIIACTRLSKITLPFVGTSKDDVAPSFDVIFGQETPEELEVVLTSGKHITNEAFINASYLTSIKFSDELETIGALAFANCATLTSVDLSSVTKLTTIGKRAFAGCISIETIALPNSITTIGEYAFADCESIETLNLPDSLTTLGVGAFSNWLSLKEVHISDANTNFKFVDGMLLTGDQTTLLLYLPGQQTKEFTLPSNIVNINAYAFSGAQYLEKITLPSNLAVLNEGVFNNCKALIEVTLPSTITSIPDVAFEGCTNLTKVNAPSIKSVGVSAFRNCASLAEFDFSQVEHFGEFAFLGCKKITKVEFSNQITSLPKQLFYECSGLTTLVFGENIVSIGDSCFESCTSLGNFDLPQSLEVIGARSFYGCNSESFTELYIPGSVKEIGANAFAWSTKVKLVYVPDTIEKISSGAFSGMAFASVCSNGFTKVVTEEATTIETKAEWKGCYDGQTGKIVCKDEFTIEEKDGKIVVTIKEENQE